MKDSFKSQIIDAIKALDGLKTLLRKILALVDKLPG